MKDFPALRKELYLKSYRNTNNFDRFYNESLFDFIVDDDEENALFRDKLIDCIEFSTYKFNNSVSIKVFLDLYSFNPVYDQAFLSFLKKNIYLVDEVLDYIPKDLNSLTDKEFLSWLKLFLEIDLPEKMLDKLSPFLECVRDDEVIIIFQLNLILQLIENNYVEKISSYNICLDNAIHSTFESPGFKSSVNQVLKKLKGSNLTDNSGDLALSIKEKIPFIRNEGILLFQFLFYGDPDHSGAGDSGGLATLLRDLGSSISSNPAMAGVITICAYDSSSSLYPFIPIRFPEVDHALVHLPIYLGGSGSSGYLPYQSLIERELSIFFDKLGLSEISGKPLFHIRYLDSASLAVSRIALNKKIPYVLTLTPDPHRKIGKGKTNDTNIGEISEKINNFNRVLIGDTLLKNAAAIIGIGKDSINTSLIPYFPQLSDKSDLIIQGIDEGIQIDIKKEKVSLENLFTNLDCTLHIDDVHVNRPVILNVGRLNPAKGQKNLLLAWDESRIWKTHNLYFIGGDFVNPSLSEKEVIDFIHKYVNERSHLKGKIRFQPSTTNPEIRSLQQVLAKREFNESPDIYVCSSLKEEFGISIIEAMSAGMLVLAPLLGGAKEYIRHGINGFMINTGSSKSIGKEFLTYVYSLSGEREKIDAIKNNAKETISKMYSLDKISNEFVKVYSRIGVNDE